MPNVPEVVPLDAEAAEAAAIAAAESATQAEEEAAAAEATKNEFETGEEIVGTLQLKKEAVTEEKIGEGAVSREIVEEAQTLLPAESTTDNTFLGAEAGIALAAKGEANIAIGPKALKTEKAGKQNIAIGTGAAEKTLGAANNIVIGSAAFQEGQSSANIAIGENTLKVAETEGKENTAIGTSALEKVTKGAENTAVGPTAGATVTTGSKNTCIGRNAGIGATTGDGNVAIGFNTSAEGKNNLTLGTNAGEGKKGDACIYIGFQATQGVATVSNKLVIANNNKKAIIAGVMSETEASQEIGFLGAAPAKRPKVKGKRTTEFAEVLKTLTKGLGELGLITDETEAG